MVSSTPPCNQTTAPPPPEWSDGDNAPESGQREREWRHYPSIDADDDSVTQKFTRQHGTQLKCVKTRLRDLTVWLPLATEGNSRNLDFIIKLSNRSRRPPAKSRPQISVASRRPGAAGIGGGRPKCARASEYHLPPTKPPPLCNYPMGKFETS